MQILNRHVILIQFYIKNMGNPLKKLGRNFDYLLDRVTYVLVGITGIFIILMAFTATFGVIKRYAFKSPEAISYEISCILLLFSFIFAIAGLERHGQHITCDVLSTRLSKSAKNITLNIIGSIAGLFFCGILTWQSLNNAMYSFQAGEVSASAWAIPLFPIKIMIPAGYGLLFLVLLIKLYRGITSINNESSFLY